jgi:hypothetical protein
MYRHLVRLVAAVVAAGASLGVSPQSPAPPQSWTGSVAIGTSPDGRDTVVSIDEQSGEGASDGFVEHAFRLQHAPGARFEFVGRATVSYDRDHLVISAGPDLSWVFTVAGRPEIATTESSVYAALSVRGLSHHWGANVHRSPNDVATMLMAGGCSATDASPCTDCQLGGPGNQGCTIGCEGASSCSTDCSDGYYACCNCPGLCRCCSAREGGQALQNARPGSHPK